MKIIPNQRSLFSIIQFLALILIVSSCIGPEVALGIDSDFERQLERADEQLLKRYQLQQNRQARRFQTIGITGGVLIFLVSSMGA